MYKQLLRNGWVDTTLSKMQQTLKEDWTVGPVIYAANDTDTRCSSNQIVIGYIPALFYSNMFSLAFLEVKSKTKLSQKKTEKDFKVGLTVVITIALAYILMYLPILIGS